MAWASPGWTSQPDTCPWDVYVCELPAADLGWGLRQFRARRLKDRDGAEGLSGAPFPHLSTVKRARAPREKPRLKEASVGRGREPALRCALARGRGWEWGVSGGLLPPFCAHPGSIQRRDQLAVRQYAWGLLASCKVVSFKIRRKRNAIVMMDSQRQSQPGLHGPSNHCGRKIHF